MCNLQCVGPKHYEKHINSQKHINSHMHINCISLVKTDENTSSNSLVAKSGKKRRILNHIAVKTVEKTILIELDYGDIKKHVFLIKNHTLMRKKLAN